MTVPHHPYPFAPRWSRFVFLAFVAVAAASLLDWSAAIPNRLAEATPARETIDSTTPPMDIGQQFYTEKSMAPAQELPAQF
jgi:hypothetical protein